jgi:type III pantothenate kinase
MLLALDVGNTQTVVGLFGDDHEPVQRWRLATVAERTADELALLVRELLALAGLPASAVDGVAVSSSVPAVTSTVAGMVQRWFEVPLVIAGAATTSWLPVRYDSPAEVGPDRLVDAIGALDLCAPPLIVVDLGTATTFNAVSAAGEYLGGAIVPGVAISLDALIAHAAALRRVELVPPQQAVGRSTVESLRSGVVLGYASLVDGMCRRFEAEIGESTVIATGGLAPLVVDQCAEVDRHEPWLTLHGLRIVYERERARAAAEEPS